MVDTNFYKLKLKAIDATTDQAAVLTFDVADDLKDKFKYKHGQYLTLRFTINGKEERRAYSLCSSPNMDTDLQIGVKRVEGGKVSNHINDNLKPGDEVEVMRPQGHFTTKLKEDHKKDYFLFGGGSGVTPLFSILKSVLEKEPKSRVFLYYQNRHENSIMFKDELGALSKRFQGQLHVQHILSRPKFEKKGGFLGMFAKKVTNWEGDTGRIDTTKATRYINQHQAGDGRVEEFFLCGPMGMMETVAAVLQNKGIDDKQIHREWFVTEDQAKKDTTTAAGAGGTKVIATISGEQFTVALKPKETILEALMRLKADPPFSCMSGACSTCMAKVVKGEVKMARCLALDESEVEEGYILTCQSVPTTETVEITYDV